MNQDRLPWENEEAAAAMAAAPDGLMPLPNLLHSKGHPEELPPISSVPPEADWDNLLSAQQRMVSRGHSISQHSTTSHQCITNTSLSLRCFTHMKSIFTLLHNLVGRISNSHS